MKLEDILRRDDVPEDVREALRASLNSRLHAEESLIQNYGELARNMREEAAALVESDTDRRRMRATLQQIVDGASARTGKAFFRELVKQLAAHLGVRYAFVSEVANPEGTKLRLLAFWNGDSFGDSFEYETAHTPCSEVIGGRTSFFASGVQEKFPEDEWLKKMGIHSYLASPLFDPSGKAIGHLGVMHDRALDAPPDFESVLKVFGARAGAEIERGKAERKLVESEERWRVLVENAPVHVCETTVEGEFISINRTVEGMTPEDVIGTSIYDFTTESFRPRLREIVDKVVRSGTPDTYEQESIGDNGGRAWYSAHVGPVVKDGRVVRLIFVVMDITARRQLERDVLEISSREQERIGQDLHDGLGQQLTAIAMGVKSLQKKSGDSEALGRIAELLNEAVEQSRGLARSLHPVGASPDDLMLKLAELAERIRDSGVRCELVCPEPVLVAGPDRATHLYRIAQEAVNNAVQHGEPGQIMIRLLADGEQITLSVEDDGTGIRMSDAPGRGMGLRIMDYRAGMVGGVLTVENNEGKGTTVSCRFDQPESEGSEG